MALQVLVVDVGMPMQCLDQTTLGNWYRSSVFVFIFFAFLMSIIVRTAFSYFLASRVSRVRRLGLLLVHTRKMLETSIHISDCLGLVMLV